MKTISKIFSSVFFLSLYYLFWLWGAGEKQGAAEHYHFIHDILHRESDLG